MGKRRVPKPMADIAVCTMHLNRRTGEVVVEYDPQHALQWEVEYMLFHASQRVMLEDGIAVEPFYEPDNKGDTA